MVDSNYQVIVTTKGTVYQVRVSQIVVHSSVEHQLGRSVWCEIKNK